MILESPVPEILKGWSNGIYREVDVFRKLEFPTQNICFRNFTFSANLTAVTLEKGGPQQEGPPP